MQYTQKYCIVSFLKPLGVGSEFSMTDWPLHVTLVGTFAINDIATLYEGLAELVRVSKPIDVTVGKDAVFGTTNVSLINHSDALLELHKQVIELLNMHEAVINSPTHQLDGFKPHCTIQQNTRVSEGDILSLSSLSIVDMFPNNDWTQRRVIKSFHIPG